MTKKIIIFILVIIILLILLFAYNYFNFLKSEKSSEIPENQGAAFQENDGVFHGPSGPPSIKGPSGPPPQQ